MASSLQSEVFFFVGSYATVPKKSAELEGRYYEGLAALPLCGGLELGMTAAGTIAANHANDEAWLLDTLCRIGKPRQWRYVITVVTSTMGAIEKNPHFGLASDDEKGRAEAVEMGRLTCAAVARLHAALGERRCCYVEFQSGPSRHTAAAKEAGVSSSAKALAASLGELLALDWQGAQLVLEHCDSYEGVAPVKGLLPLQQDLEALKLVNEEAAERGKVLLTINWARSVLESRDVDTAVKHVEEAAKHNLLSGLMFSGCSGVAGPYGQWKDTHMPHGREPGAEEEKLEHWAEGSLLTHRELRRCFAAAGGRARLAYAGIKITAKHASDTDVSTRLGLIRDMLRLCNEEAVAADGDEASPPPEKAPRVA